MRVLIIGGTGFTGPSIVRRLARQGHTVAVFHRRQTTAILPDAVQHIQGDRDRLLAHARALRSFSPEVVVDMIPITERHAKDVVGIFSGVAQRVVAISSQDVYRAYGRLARLEAGPVEPMPVTEDSPLRKSRYPYRANLESVHRLYDYDKILVEQVYMGNPVLPGTIVRYPMVYGPGDKQHRCFPYLKRMDDGRSTIVLAKSLSTWRWTRGYAEDVAGGVTLAITTPHALGRIFKVGETHALREHPPEVVDPKAFDYSAEDAIWMSKSKRHCNGTG